MSPELREVLGQAVYNVTPARQLEWQDMPDRVKDIYRVYGETGGQALINVLVASNPELEPMIKKVVEE